MPQSWNILWLMWLKLLNKFLVSWVEIRLSYNFLESSHWISIVYAEFLKFHQVLKCLPLENFLNLSRISKSSSKDIWYLITLLVCIFVLRLWPIANEHACIRGRAGCGWRLMAKQRGEAPSQQLATDFQSPMLLIYMRSSLSLVQASCVPYTGILFRPASEVKDFVGKLLMVTFGGGHGFRRWHSLAAEERRMMGRDMMRWELWCYWVGEMRSRVVYYPPRQQLLSTFDVFKQVSVQDCGWWTCGLQRTGKGEEQLISTLSSSWSLILHVAGLGILTIRSSIVSATRIS
jgi:hypothetical protein